MRWRVISLVVLATCLWATCVSAAAARTSAHASRPVTLKLEFARAGSGNLLGDGRYVVMGMSLIDSRTGQRTQISAPGCFLVNAVGGGWVVLTCGTDTAPSYSLYDIGDGQTLPLTINQSLIQPDCDAGDPGCENVTAIGSDWIAFAPMCVEEHCNMTFAFQNLSTGETAPDPTNRTTAVDLNSSTLGQQVCSPVTVPTTDIGSEGNLQEWGSLEFDGRFAVATSNGGSFLVRCASNLQQRLTYTSYPGCAHAACSPPFNSHLIVWESRPLQLTGIFLPSLRRFTIPVPGVIDPSPGMYVNGDRYALALTDRTLYVGNGRGVWSVPMPSGPPRPKRRPHHR